MPNMAELVTIPNVELCETGIDWPASTGPVTFTQDDLISASEAPYLDSAIKLPRMRFGHTGAGTSIHDSMAGFTEQPCVGKFVNLRVENEGNLLVADLVGVPAWLAEILPIAYPNRSVEAYFEVSTSTGKKHRMVVTSVALLGENLPGVQTLEDLEYLFSDDPDEWISALQGGEKVAASQSTTRGDQVTKRVAASVDTGDVRSAFYEQVATEEEGRYWWWLHQMYLDPSVCIAEDESMEYWLVPYSATASGIEFEDPVKVKIQWVEEDSGNVRASGAANVDSIAAKLFGHASHMWVAASDSRPPERQAEWSTKNQEAKPAMGIDIPALRAKLGLSETDLPDDATEEQINTALAADPPEPTETESDDESDDNDSTETEDVDVNDANSVAAAIKSGRVRLVDASVWEDTRKGAQAGTDLQNKADRDDNRAFLESAVREGRIPRSALSSYQKQMDGPDNSGRGPARAAIREMVGGLEKGVIAPTEEIGHSEGENNTITAQTQGTGLFPKLEQRRAAAAAAAGEE